MKSSPHTILSITASLTVNDFQCPLQLTMGSSVPTSHPTGRLGEAAFPGTQAAEGKQYRQKGRGSGWMPSSETQFSVGSSSVWTDAVSHRNRNSGQSVDEMKNVNIKVVTVVTINMEDPACREPR